MSFSYIHLSDIHFGQEKGSQVFVNDDVKEELISDVRKFVSELPSKTAHGIIISGDIAYAGKKEEYDNAGQWLHSLTAAAGCERTSVQMVPGNHDVDQSKISFTANLMVKEISINGDKALDQFLESEVDREVFYNKFLLTDLLPIHQLDQH